MNEQPSYNTLPGNRSGSGSASVLGYLLTDLARKPAPAVQQPALSARRLLPPSFR